MTRRLGLAAVVGAMVLPLAGPAVAAPVVARVPSTRLITPDVNLRDAINALRAGDTLALAPGTYRPGWIVMRAGGGVLGGTAAAPITITSADPAHPAVIYGGLEFDHASYVNLFSVRVIATRPGFFALYMFGGVGWQVAKSEFTGARATHAVANVMIGGSGGEPSGFRFVQNNVHTAANDLTTDHIDQNVYVNYQGAPGSGGLIANNLIWDHPNGEGIKVGVGGLATALGAWNLTIAYNTIASGGRQIVLTGVLRNIRILRNHFYRATQFFVSNPQTTQIYIHDVTGSGFTVVQNYSYGASMLIYDPMKRTALSGNVVSNAPAYNPRFDVSLRPTNRVAVPYGRYARIL